MAGHVRICYPLILLTFFFGACSCSKTALSDEDVTDSEQEEPAPSLATVRSWLVDKDATDETAALFYNLKRLSGKHILFGHQDATKRGLHPAGEEWANEEHMPAVARDKSDVKEVTGAFPAVYGHDFMHIANFVEEGQNWFEYEKDIARQLTIDAYHRGGVNTYAWHYDNPVSKGRFYWDDSPVRAVGRIIPGGDHHEVYKSSLRTIADFAKSLVADDGQLVPVIFRPFHEFDGDWFWWGKSHCSPEEYKALYRFTVSYLKELGVSNFIYAWSPDKNFNTEAQFLERYPGNDYVDLVGMDNYGDLEQGRNPAIAAGKLKIVAQYAAANNKLAALTETGLQNLTQSDWYTQQLLAVLQQERLSLSYVLVWVNRKDAFWTPYAGHNSAADFINFKANPYILFGDQVGSLYAIE